MLIRADKKVQQFLPSPAHTALLRFFAPGYGPARVEVVYAGHKALEVQFDTEEELAAFEEALKVAAARLRSGAGR